MADTGLRRGVWFACSILLVLLAWEAVCRFFAVPSFILPPPSIVMQSLWEMKGPLLGHHLMATLQEVLIGLGLSVVLGPALALLMRSSRVIEQLLYPMLVISQTIPIIALSPVLVLWFGYELTGKIAVTMLFTFFPIVVSTYDGLGQTRQEMVDLFRTMGANRRQIFFKLRLPASLPTFFSGLKVAATYSVAGATIGEWLGASAGLGYYARRASGNFQAPALFASVLILSLLGMLMFTLVSLVERRFTQTKRKAR